MPKISIIIPTYNRVRYIKDAIDSVLAQEYNDYEIIVMDDGSTDKTKESLDAYIKSGKIRYFYQENKGISVARNRGINESVGKYLAFLDSDDLWLPDKLKEQVRIFDSSDVGLVYSYARFLNTVDEHFEIKPKFISQTFQEMLNCPTQLPTSTVMLRRECINKVGNFDEKLGIFEDLELWIRVAQHYKIKFIDKILAVHRLHGNNTAYDQEKIHLNNITYFENSIKLYPLLVNIKELRGNIAHHAYFAGREYMRQGKYLMAKTVLKKAISQIKFCFFKNQVVCFKSLIAYFISWIKCSH